MPDVLNADLTQNEDSPFALLPDEVFRIMDQIDESSCFLFFGFMICVILPPLYFVIFPLAIYWLSKFIRLKLGAPLLVGWRTHYDGLSWRELKKLAQYDERLAKVMRMRRSCWFLCLSLCWPLMIPIWIAALTVIGVKV